MKLKFRYVFPNIPLDVLWRCLQPSKRNEYENNPQYEKIDEMTDKPNLGEVYYILNKKPPIPLMSQRDSVIKMFVRESYHLRPNTHVYARHTVPCNIEKYQETKSSGLFSKGFQRMNQIILGQVVTENAEHNGSEVVMVMHTDLCGSVPGTMIGIA